MAQHVFTPFVSGDFICCKCGVVVIDVCQMQIFNDHDDCISDHDPRCAETSEAIKLHIEEMGELEAISYPYYTPSSRLELKQFMDWLNLADPVKALWGIR